MMYVFNAKIFYYFNVRMSKKSYAGLFQCGPEEYFDIFIINLYCPVTPYLQYGKSLEPSSQEQARMEDAHGGDAV